MQVLSSRYTYETLVLKLLENFSENLICFLSLYDHIVIVMTELTPQLCNIMRFVCWSVVLCYSIITTRKYTWSLHLFMVLLAKVGIAAFTFFEGCDGKIFLFTNLLLCFCIVLSFVSLI